MSGVTGMTPPGRLLHVQCPQCGTQIPLPAAYRPVTVTTTDGRTVSTVRLVPDMTDVYAHRWTHDTEEGPPDGT